MAASALSGSFVGLHIKLTQGRLTRKKDILTNYAWKFLKIWDFKKGIIYKVL
jgi:hypothetical protein